MAPHTITANYDCLFCPFSEVTSSSVVLASAATTLHYDVPAICLQILAQIGTINLVTSFMHDWKYALDLLKILV